MASFFSMSNQTDCLWTAKEAAAYFKVTVRWLRDSGVPKVLLGAEGKRRLVRYLPEECAKFARLHLTHTLEN